MTPVPSGSDRYACWDAAYVLGSLSSADRREYETHLGTCADCRTSVAELGGIPALLGLLRPDELPADVGAPGADTGLRDADSPRPQLLDDLVREVARRRRHARRLALTATGLAVTGLAAAVILVFGGLIVWRPAPNAPPYSPVAAALTMVPVATPELTATVTLNSRQWGTDIDLTCTYRADIGESEDPGASGDQLVLVAVGRDGSRNELATWVEHDGATAMPTASTSLRIEEIHSLEVLAKQTSQLLLRREL